jgi:hypothetical protein
MTSVDTLLLVVIALYSVAAAGMGYILLRSRRAKLVTATDTM